MRGRIEDRSMQERLPSAEGAWVPVEKVSAYLLSDEHPAGASKARFFRRQGYSRSAPDILAADLRAVASTGRMVARSRSSHGEKFVLDGWIDTPAGNRVSVRTVWIVEADCPARLVTAYPA
jgi:hypothetical protein